MIATIRNKMMEHLISLFVQVASTPFILANGILKSIVEHMNYRNFLGQESQRSETEGIA
ncbi:hypothetical protein LJR153_007274 [Paenibacillus sp. LjRoot153]|uniref:hypothetical protein n=1 Tax=Paenibacillus sp. LjRoot153 TaxID=3342270 RepID=UPI003ED0F74E